ncbi:MAG: DUF86 domain-containing protein [Leptospirales bacterium]
MKKNDDFYLFHIRESINLIAKYTENIEISEFIQDSKTHDAVIRQLEIIGEASSKLSSKTRERMAGIPWKDVIGMRNILIHHYFGVDLESVWETVQNDLHVMLAILPTI